MPSAAQLARHRLWVAEVLPEAAAPTGADAGPAREAEAVVVPAPFRDQQAVLVIEEEESLQLRAGRHLFEGAVGRGLIIS